ncbi:MAG: response regulator [Chitinophagaceae bacterium]|nr:response regulator [Oligoflexus sp.]
MRRKNVISSLSCILVVIIIFSFAYLPMRIMKNATHDAGVVSHTYEVRKEIRDISDVLRSIIYLHQNYMFTGIEAFRFERNQAVSKLRIETNEVIDLVHDNPAQHDKIKALQAAITNYFLPFILNEEELPRFIYSRAQFVQLLNHETTLNPIFDLVQELDRNEADLLEVRQRLLDATIQKDSFISLGMGFAAVALLVSMFGLYKIDVEEKEATSRFLRHANSEVEKANHMKSAFLANMSHEIRTPLGAILGFAELLSVPVLSDSERIRYVDVIRRNGKALSQLIDDILDLSKVEAGKISIEKIDCDLEDLLLDISQMFKGKAEEKHILFRIETIGYVPKSPVSDPLRIRQILINLVGNAVKFTDAGYVAIRLAWIPHPSFKNQGDLVFTVVDSGVGIARDLQDKLFQPFTQAEDSTARKFGGTGLGLTLSRRLARLLDGDVALKESVPNVGSQFELKIPVAAPTPEALRLPPHLHVSHFTEDHTATEGDLQTKREAEDESLTLKDVHILLAEDAPDNQLLITQILEATGAKVSVVGNGRDAVTSAMAGGQDLILMDIQMPILGGYEAAQELRSNGYQGPIVALSALAMVKDKEKSQRSGYDDHLTKPINSEKLIATIKHLTRDLPLDCHHPSV